MRDTVTSQETDANHDVDQYEHRMHLDYQQSLNPRPIHVNFTIYHSPSFR